MRQKNGVNINTLIFLLTLTFIALKLGETVNWSWWIVFLPMIIAIAIKFLPAAIMFIIAGVLYVVEKASLFFNKISNLLTRSKNNKS